VRTGKQVKEYRTSGFRWITRRQANAELPAGPYFMFGNVARVSSSTHRISVPGCDLYVGGGEAVTGGGMFVCLSNSNSLSRYSCMDAW